MGQGESKPESLGLDQVSRLFAQACGKQFSSIEVYSLKSNVTRVALKDEKGGKAVDMHALTDCLNVPEWSQVAELLFQSVSFLAAFPKTTPVRELGVEGLVKAMAFYNGKYKNILGERFDIVRLLFMSFAKIDELKSEVDGEFDEGEIEPWSQFGPVKSIQEISAMHVTAHNLYLLFTFLLSISHFHAFDSMTSIQDRIENDSKLMVAYKKCALCLLRTIHPHISTVSSLEGVTVTWKQFEPAFKSAFWNIFNPLGELFDQLLFMDTKSKSRDEHRHPVAYDTKLFNSAVAAQLSTMLEGVDTANMVRLYAGSDAGFSMRSFESKVFKWAAPTILLVSGKTFNADKPKNMRQRSFDEMIPPTRSSRPPSAARTPSQHSLQDSVSSTTSLASSSVSSNRRMTFGVYLETPWRASTKECFADDKSVLFQLNPCQDVYRADPAKHDFAYYSRSHAGGAPGGIGFGSTPPVMRNYEVKFDLGNVSLTIEEALEFAVFRHLGAGGSFEPSRVHPDVILEERFSIDEVEVWGCGSQVDLDEQRKNWEWEEREAQYRQSVNVKSTNNHEEDRALLELAGIIQNHSGGSV